MKNLANFIQKFHQPVRLVQRGNARRRLGILSGSTAPSRKDARLLYSLLSEKSDPVVAHDYQLFYNYGSMDLVYIRNSIHNPGGLKIGNI